ncbi:MAG: hypothetical protein ABUL42_02550 [Terricaulis silvestris]
MADSAKALPPAPVRKRWRAAIALVLSALAADVVLVGIVQSINSIVQHRLLPWKEIGTVGAAVLVVAIAASVVLLWPFHAIALRRGWRRLLTYVFFGLLLAILAVGALTYIFVQSRPSAPEDTERQWVVLGGLFIIGIVAGIPSALLPPLFWLIRRPDRDPMPSPHALFE